MERKFIKTVMVNNSILAKGSVLVEIFQIFALTFCILYLNSDSQQLHTFFRAHQTGRSGRNSRPMSAEVALPRLQSEIKAAMFLFGSRSFLANNLYFMVKLIDKAIVISVKIHKNERKRLYSSNKICFICWDKRIMANF